ncbi:MAG: response regulator [Treponema sp.]|nr:response regulator [Treponema sp.]
MEKGKNNKPTVYSALEVANICGVVNQTAINWIRSNHLAAFKTPGGQFRVYPEDLVAFMESRGMRVPTEVLDCCENKVVVKPHTLLIVDDDKALNNVISQYLKKQDESIQVFQAYDGFEAGSQLVQRLPRCVILDLDLPGIDGLRLCNHLRQSDAFGHPAIIVITAMDDPENEKQCLDLGCRCFFRKPLNLPLLAENLARLFDES